MKIGVVGSTTGIFKEIVFKVLDDIDLYLEDPITVVSGGARLTDTYAIQWAIEKGKDIKVFYPSGKVITNPDEYDPEYHEEPPEYKKEQFFARNKKIANAVQELYCFIPMAKYRDGTWNTIKHFLDRNFEDQFFDIYDQRGDLWESDDLPSCVLKRLQGY